MALNSAAITAGMAALTVTGVTIKDTGTLPAKITVRDTPILIPLLDQFTAGGNDGGNSTFGTPGTRYWEYTRIFRYLYLHAIAGAVRVPADVAGAMLTKQDLLMEAIAELDIASVDVMGITCSAFGVFSDPSESERFYGFALDIQFREKVNP